MMARAQGSVMPCVFAQGVGKGVEVDSHAHLALGGEAFDLALKHPDDMLGHGLPFDDGIKNAGKGEGHAL